MEPTVGYCAYCNFDTIVLLFRHSRGLHLCKKCHIQLTDHLHKKAMKELNREQDTDR